MWKRSLMNNTRRTNFINNISTNKHNISRKNKKHIKLKDEYKFYKTLQNAIYTEYPYYSYILWPNGIPKMYYSIIRVLNTYKNSTMYGFIAKEINNFIDKIIDSPDNQNNSLHSISSTPRVNQSNKKGVSTYDTSTSHITKLYNELANTANNVRLIEKVHNIQNMIPLKFSVKPKNGYDVLIDMIMLCFINRKLEGINIKNILYIFDFDMNTNKKDENEEIKERIERYNDTKNIGVLRIKPNVNDILISPSGIYYALNIFFNDHKKANDELNEIIKKLGNEANDISKIFLLDKTALITPNTVEYVNDTQHFSECFKNNYKNAIKLLKEKNNDPYHIYEKDVKLEDSYFKMCET